MADNKGSEQKKEHQKSKANSISPEECHQKWKEHFKNLLGKAPEISDKNINGKRGIKLGYFLKENLTQY